VRCAALGAALGLVLAGPRARADTGPLLVGTSDPALVSELSVAVSSRGLSVVELPEPLHASRDLVAARIAVAARDAVAIVWLCDDDAGARALCFYGRDGRFVARPVAVTSPLTPPDAAALALSVKLLLWGARPSPAPAAPASSPPPPPPPTPQMTTALAPAPRAGAPIEPAPRPSAAPLAVEVTGGARVQASDAERVALRLGAKVVYVPGSRDRRVGFGLGVSAGPALAARSVSGVQAQAMSQRKLSDVAVGLLARGRQRLGTAWLELDVGPFVHTVSPNFGARHADLALDAVVGVVVPWGRTFAGARVGGFRLLTSSASDGVDLPPWNGEALLCVGVTFP